MDFNMTKKEKQNYHATKAGGSKSIAYYDGQQLAYLKSQLEFKGTLTDEQIESLYKIFIKSFKHSTYAIQEVKAFIAGKRINRAECE